MSLGEGGDGKVSGYAGKEASVGETGDAVRVKMLNSERDDWDRDASEGVTDGSGDASDELVGA